MGEGLVIEQPSAAVMRILLNRPEVHNALSIALSRELHEALVAARESREVKVVVLGGCGESFCSGEDVSELGQWGDANDVMRRARACQALADELEALDKLTIAAVDGYALGGGLELTMACDFVLATERARWGMPEVDIGIAPGWRGTGRLTRLIGRRMAKEVNVIGALHPARRAIELGLWNRLVADDALDGEVQALVEVLLSKSQQAVRQAKLVIDSAVDAGPRAAQGLEALSAGLGAAVAGLWQVEDADRGVGVVDYLAKAEGWTERRALARDFWADGPLGAGAGGSSGGTAGPLGAASGGSLGGADDARLAAVAEVARERCRGAT